MRPEDPRETKTETTRIAGRRRIPLLAVALAVSWGSMLLHNQWELPLTPISIENTGPLAFDVVLLLACWRWPRSRVAWSVVLGWGLLNMVVGGIITVIPLPVLPFVPEQTIDHYLVHVIYTAGQLPLVLVAVASLGQLRARAHTDGGRHA